MSDVSRIDDLVGATKSATDEQPDTSVESPGTGAEDTNVDKIREILFGGQMRDYEQRFALLEEKLAQQLQTLQQDVKRDLDALEDYSRREVEKLTETQHKEKQERAEALKTVAESVDQVSREMEKKLADVEQSMSRDGSDLRSALLDARKILSEDLKNVRAELLDLIQRENSALQSAKVGRTEISGLLNDLAVRLSDDSAD